MAEPFEAVARTGLHDMLAQQNVALCGKIAARADGGPTIRGRWSVDHRRA
jgi:hypothetical protein